MMQLLILKVSSHNETSRMSFINLFNFLQINSPSVVSVTVDILQQIVHIVILHRILRRFSILSHNHRHQLLRHHHPNLENTFHRSLKINRKMPETKAEMTQQQFVFPIFLRQQAMLTWKSSRTNLARNRKCIWLRIKILDYVKDSPTFTSIVRKMQPLLLRHLTVLDMIT